MSWEDTKKIYELELVDGFGKEWAIMVTAPKGKTCEDDFHCAHHGSGPYICCKCGAEFKSLYGYFGASLCSTDWKARRKRK